MNAEETVEAVLIALNSDDAKLARAEFLVVVCPILMIAFLIMDGYRLRSNSSFVKTVLLILETVTVPLFTYTISLLQNVSFNNQFLAIWGVLLYLLRPDTEFITAYSIMDASMRRRIELRELLLTFFAGNLNATKGSKFQGLLWVLVSLGSVMIIYKIISYERARNSYSHGQNSKLLVEYMKIEPSNKSKFVSPCLSIYTRSDSERLPVYFTSISPILAEDRPSPQFLRSLVCQYAHRPRPI